MKKLLPYFKEYKKESILGPLFKLIEAGFDLLVPVVVGMIVDKGLGEYVSNSYPFANKGYIVRMSGVLFAFGVVGLICSITAQYFAAKAATGVSSGIRRALFKKIQSLSYADLDKTGTSTLLTRLTDDINRFQTGVNMFLRLFLRSPFIVFGAMIAAFFIDVPSALVFAVAIPVLSVAVFVILYSTLPLYRKAQESLDNVLLATRENLTGVRVIRAFCSEEEEIKSFKNRTRTLTKRRFFADGVSALLNPLTYVLVNLSILILLRVGGVRVYHGNLTQGQVLAMYNLMSQILVELIKLANLTIAGSKAVACGNRIEKVLSLENSLIMTPNKEEENTENTEEVVVFDHVFLRYPDGGEDALSDITFTVKKGETIGIIGGTGSGKTTLVNLIPHFYDRTGGKVSVLGKDVESYSLPFLREKIGVVPQKAVLFKGTIGDNLRWRKENASDEELLNAAKIACAEEVIAGKGGLNAEVEQSGKNFSGGQKQRLTVARALVGEPEILIMDDSSSALDYATDAAMRSQIRNLTYKPTVFVVSQRASSVMKADKIIVLDEGKAVGIGTHAELMKNCSVYKEIYASQYPEGAEA